jgi:ferredoxin, 2Fe-2S
MQSGSYNGVSHFSSQSWDSSFFQYICSLKKKKEPMYTIKFKFEQRGLEPITLDNIESGQTLLEIALKNDIELHHNCGGVCACTTCHLYVENGMDCIDEISDKEEDFIDRAVNPTLNSRLGCQSLLLDEGSGLIEVKIPDQTQFLGE